MSDKTGIDWTDATWNPVRGCSRVSEGCRNCYAETVAARFSKPFQMDGAGTFHGFSTWDPPRWTGKVELVPEKLDQPLRWKKPRRIFVNSMSDLFHESLPDEAIAAVFAVMMAAPQHTFQVLTKRPARMLRWFDWVAARGGIHTFVRNMTVDRKDDPSVAAFRRPFEAMTLTEEIRPGKIVRSRNDPWMQVFNAAAIRYAGPLFNVWLGVSVEDQERADERIPLLLQTPAAVRFVSAEPLLGPVSFDSTHESDPCASSFLSGIGGERVYDGQKVAIDWVIVGGESGPGARPMEVAWARSIVSECKAAGVPVFMKQLGARPIVPASRQAHHDWPYASFSATDPMYPSSAPWRVKLPNRKGGDPAEWPEDLRVREFPVVGAA